ncbi:hypothetical protein AcW1_007625 [Taiwanofungus camphoratus]|nr:hypothetical protein AcW2_007312 [Antrodia cinnamomea]KAI0927012.1 hypothetical protein AcV5_007657 [Antrodia cinnamomea]KAI0953394.1 hypothetical protein AcW1_007625 [Antrodia cinnamomea]
MLFSVARLRLSISCIVLLSASTRASEEVLFTSSVSYCSPPEEILVDQFYAKYYRQNNTVSWNISAASVLPNVNVSANLNVNVYGLQPLNLSLPLCNYLDGLLCPLPEYNFDSIYSLTIPPSVKFTSEIPGIAYRIPNLEAFAQLTLIEVGSGNVKACLQSTLSNGWSAHQRAVEWTTGAIALFALIWAIWQSVVTDTLALAPIRLLDLVYLFQTIAVSGLLGLDYPSIYTAFTLNFSWVLGLFAASPSSSIQTSINNMRHLTGGNLANASSGGATPLVNRKLSPYNFGAPDSVFAASQSLLEKAASLPHLDLADKHSLDSLRNASNNTTVLIGRDVEIVLPDSPDVLQAGIPIYTNSIGIATANAFMTIFLITLIYAAVVLVSLALGYAVFHGLSRTAWGKHRLHGFPGLESGYFPFARAWGLRAVLVTVLPVLVFAFYQWTLDDSWLSILLSVLLLVIVLALVLPPVYLVLRPYLPHFLSRISRSDSTTYPSLVPLTAPFRPERVYYVVPIAVAMLTKALVVAFASTHGLVQAIIFVVIEGLLFIAMVALKPHRTRHADILQGYLAITRVVTSGLLIAFAESLALPAIPRVVVGCIIGVLFSIAVIVMFLNTLVDMGLWRLVRRVLPCRRRRRRGDRELASNSSQNDVDASVVVNAEGEKEKSDREASSFAGSSRQYSYYPEYPAPPGGEPQPANADSEHLGMYPTPGDMEPQEALTWSHRQ